MRQESNDKIIYGRFGGQHAPAVVQDGTGSLTRGGLIEHLSRTFKGLIRRPVSGAWIGQSDGSAAFDQRKPSTGPYNAFIGYYEDGRANHFLRFVIDKMRDSRAYTRNAVELRCDALCLAVYVSGITQIDPVERKASEGLRVVVYDHDSLKSTSMCSVKNPEELADKLYQILVTTYNRLSRQYNLAGFTSDFLVLRSSHPAIPDIGITMER
ncbi:hypothetical protein EGJ86_19155 [Pseudomonas sp. o96-267]|uniref:hypothetical protein n=1 Tax=Pseudomonas sp. o96-267 TaxID=2479853 RepID=UPI000F76C67B|nr:MULTISPECIES: hypothetical protein [Pseudomonas]MDH0959113.1 hypothetical protein [Pseudomonas chengduensis]MDV5863579.1 hypothetical protein [Pseudomonas mendocina]RRV31692.1 hypothetical protein EGJ86_19155 [Pseudomonas sp. o96-267]